MSQAKKALHRVPEDECHLAVAAFGSKRGEAQRCEVVRIRVKTRDGADLELTLFVNSSVHLLASIRTAHLPMH